MRIYNSLCVCVCVHQYRLNESLRSCVTFMENCRINSSIYCVIQMITCVWLLLYGNSSSLWIFCGGQLFTHTHTRDECSQFSVCLRDIRISIPYILILYDWIYGWWNSLRANKLFFYPHVFIYMPFFSCLCNNYSFHHFVCTLNDDILLWWWTRKKFWSLRNCMIRFRCARCAAVRV